MIYKDFKDIKISNLGLGCMRLPVIDGDSNRIDEEKAYEMVKLSIESGINYFDTAYGYHGGNSETIMGKILNRFPRNSYYLASKFPGYDQENFKNIEKIFEEQLKKCQVEYFDFYLFHNVCERNIDQYLDDNIGLFKFLMKQKSLGRIKYLGFSAHAEMDTLKKFLDKYGNELDFCQLQINYVDWTLQNANEKIELLKQYNLPVWVMEPLRGGRLANIDQESMNYLAKYKDASHVEWAFRFLQSIPTVTVILSGMSNMEQLKDNINIFSTDEPLIDVEMDAILNVARKLSNGIPCTECRYCTTYCPKELDIPYLINKYNETSFLGRVPFNMQFVPKDKLPSECIGCRSCEAVCPQQIEISDVMNKFSLKLLDK